MERGIEPQLVHESERRRHLDLCEQVEQLVADPLTRNRLERIAGDRVARELVGALFEPAAEPRPVSHRAQ